jgi:hypothetical protein
MSIVLTQIFKDFPKNLPKDIKGPVFRKLEEIFDMFPSSSNNRGRIDKNVRRKRESENMAGSSKKQSKSDDYVAGQATAEILMLMTNMLAIDGTIDFKKIDFQRLQLSQELVMHYSHFEGILADSLRTMCSVRPELMKRKKTVEMEEVLSCGSWDGVVNMLTEKFVRDIGWESLEKRIGIFDDLFNLKAQIDKEERRIIKEVDLIRNLIVHNAGKASQEYITLRRTKDLKVGDYIPLDSDYLQLVSSTLNVIASEIYIEISKEYFGKKEEEAIDYIATKRGL